MPDIDDAAKLQELQRLYPSSIELSKNSRGFTWCIKIRGQDGNEQELIERVEKLNKEMERRFPESKG